MSLLQDIQNAAIDSQSDLASVLRKSRVLAARLKNEDFIKWVQYELDGYPLGCDVPEYRKCNSESVGYFAGLAGSELRNAPIPPMCIPEQYRELMGIVEFRQGVTALKNIAEQSKGLNLTISWPGDLIALMAGKVYNRMNMMQAHQIIPVSAIIGVLDTVRNRILNFALEIESASPDGGELSTSVPSLTAEKVGTVFNTYIWGNVGNLASGSSDFSQAAPMNIQAGDLTSLERYLKSIEVEEVDITELKDAIAKDPKPQSSSSFGAKTASWLGGMIGKSAQGAWKIGAGVASNLLARALAAYYGIGT